MIDDLFDALNIIDRVEGWLAGLLNFERGTHGQRRRKRGLVELRVGRAEGKSGEQIEAYLRGYGVPVHGRRVTGQEIVFSVPAQQARWAKALLGRMDGARPRAWATDGNG